jgi:hypothetical protein
MDRVIFPAQYGANEDGNDVAMALLHAVADEGKLLLERREDINDRNSSNQTPLKRTAKMGEPRYRMLLG